MCSTCFSFPFSLLFFWLLSNCVCVSFLHLLIYSGVLWVRGSRAHGSACQRKTALEWYVVVFLFFVLLLAALVARYACLFGSVCVVVAFPLYTLPSISFSISSLTLIFLSL